MMNRLAVEENGLLQNELGIKDPKHRKKIGLRAMDIVLFGPPFGKLSVLNRLIAEIYYYFLYLP